MLVTLTWSSTVLYLTGTYLLISLGPSNSSVTSCRLSSLPSTPYLGVKPVFILSTMCIMFAIYGNILKKWVHGQIGFRITISYFRIWSFNKRKKACGSCTSLFGDSSPGRPRILLSPCPQQALCQSWLAQLVAFKKILYFLAKNKYVMIILLVYSVSWLPWTITFVVDIILVNTGYYQRETVRVCGNFSDDERDTILAQLQSGTGIS